MVDMRWSSTGQYKGSRTLTWRLRTHMWTGLMGTKQRTLSLQTCTAKYLHSKKPLKRCQAGVKQLSRMIPVLLGTTSMSECWQSLAVRLQNLLMLLLRFLPPFPANYFSNVYLKKIYLAKTLNFLISIKGALHMSLQLVWMRSYSKYNGKITFQVHSLAFLDFLIFNSLN